MSDFEVKRGDIFFADLSPVVGSEQGGVRPVLIIQNNIGNKFSPSNLKNVRLGLVITGRKGTEDSKRDGSSAITKVKLNSRQKLTNFSVSLYQLLCLNSREIEIFGNFCLK